MDNKPTQQSNTTASGLEPNIAGLLSYVLGWLSGLIFFLIEKDNKFVRFHAIQSMVTFGAVTVILIVLTILRAIFFAIFYGGLRSWSAAAFFNTVFNGLSVIIWLGAIVLAIILMIKAYQNEMFKLPIAGNIAEKNM